MSKLRIASISDIHLGHPNTPTVSILANLRKAFPDNEETGLLDLIFFGGDLFDRLLDANDPNFFEFQIWAHRFISMCARRNITVRVLEGTPSHDWKLNRHLVDINENANLNCDLKYVSTLSIEHIEKFGIDVLYVPDEWHHETDQTWMEVQQLLAASGLDQVDYTVLHGSMTYQLPEHVKAPMHVPERYLSITRRYMFVGHVHKSSKYDRILANGSFDRLSHGEEEAKGHWRVVVGGPAGDELVFVENKGAKLYKSIDCTGLPTETALKKLECVREYPPDSYVRVIAETTDPILASLDVLRKTYPLLNWTSKKLEGPTTQAKLLVDMRSSFTQINITPENIETLVLEKIRSMTSDERVINRCMQRLRETIQ